MESYIWIGLYIAGFLAFLVAAFSVDDGPETKTRAGIICVLAVIWPVAILTVLFMLLMSKS